MAQGENAEKGGRPGYEWGSRRWPGDYRFPGWFTKYMTKRYERRQAKQEIKDALAQGGENDE